MIDYKDIVKNLRMCTGNRDCKNCPYRTEYDCFDHLKNDAADAIEAINADAMLAERENKERCNNA